MTDAGTNRSRRKLLSALGAGGAAAFVGTALPRAWLRPVIESVVLPLHAQASPVNFSFSCVANPPSGGTIAQNGFGTFTFSVTPNPGPINVDVEISCDGMIVSAFPFPLNANGEIVQGFGTFCTTGQVQVFRFIVPSNGQSGTCSWTIGPPTANLTSAPRSSPNPFGG